MLPAGEYVPVITDLARLGPCDIDSALLVAIISGEGGLLPPLAQGEPATETSPDARDTSESLP
jgi:hypothetical protein